jgi:hypothetical protein
VALFRGLLCLVALAVAAFVPASAQGELPAWPNVFDPLVVSSLRLEIEPQDWDTIRRDTTNEIEVPALFNADGESQILVSVRRKSSRALPSESNPVKVGLKIDINEFVDQKWHGLIKLSLENGADSSPLAEGVAWNLHELASVTGFYGANYHGGLASWTRVYVNGELLGLYVSVEDRDKQFLKNHTDELGNPYFVSGMPIWLYEIDDIPAGSFELEVGDPHSPTWNALCYAPFQGKKTATCPFTATPTGDALAADLNAKIEMQAMLTQGALDAITGNRDALFTHGKNYRHVDFASEDGRKRRYYPWDLDAAFLTTPTASIYGTASGRKGLEQTGLQKLILNNSTFRAQYNGIVLGLTEPGTGPISLGSINAFLDAVEPVLSSALDEDPYIDSSSASLFAGIRAYLLQRIPNARDQADG